MTNARGAIKLRVVLTSEQKQQAFYWRLNGLSYAEIGRRIGVSRQRIQQITSAPKKIALLVKKRANSLCERCGVEVPNGHIHHVASGVPSVEAYNDVSNLVYLCVSCHVRAHHPWSVKRVKAKVKAPRKAGEMTVREAAAKLGITLDAVYRLLWAGKMRGSRNSNGDWVVSDRSVAIRLASKRRARLKAKGVAQ